MPRGRADHDSSENSSLTAPPDAPTTEQYPSVYRRNSGSSRATSGALAAYHARATSYGSETDGREDDEDTLTMPVPGNVTHSQAVAAHVRPQQHQQQHFIASPHRSTTAAPPPPAAATEVSAVQPHAASPLSTSDAPHTAASLVTAPPSRHAPPPSSRTSIVNSSGFFYSTRGTNGAAAPSAPSEAHPTKRRPPPPPQPVADASETVRPLSSFTRATPSPSPVTILQQQQQQQRHTSPQQTAGAAAAHHHQQPEPLLLPAPFNRPSSPPPSPRAAQSPSLMPPVASTHSASALQWQLSSPQDRPARGGQAAPRSGAIFEYASEAVNTLEQQYGDALQRLSTMHRLYDRLDEHNHTLEAELARLRRVNDVLHKGVAFNVYNSVRQVKHEMKLLRQYVAVLFTGFSNSMEALQQVVAEDVPRLLGRDSSYTALLPYGAQGRLRPTETRVSVGRSSNFQDALSAPSLLPMDSMSHPRHAGSGGVGAMAESQLYQPDYWWNAMSPAPLRPPLTLEQQQQQQQQHEVAEASGWEGDVAYYSTGNDGGAGASPEVMEGRGSRALFPPPPPQQQLQQRQDAQAMVSYNEYRRVQTALAEAQRRVVELEQLNSNQQSEYEARVAQLKVAHRARQARVEEELAMLRRVEPIIKESDPVSAAETFATTAAGGGSGGNGTTTVDINALAQLLHSLQLQQQQQQQQDATTRPLMSASVTSKVHPTGAQRNGPFSDTSDDVERGGHGADASGEEEDDGMVDSRDPHSSSSRRSRSQSTTEEDGDYAYHYGLGDPRFSFDRVHRRVVQATALGKNRLPTASGDDGRLHRPDRYSPAAAARRTGRAQQVLGEGTEQQEEEEEMNAAAAAAASRRLSRSVAYDHLMGGQRRQLAPSTSPSKREGVSFQSRVRCTADASTHPERNQPRDDAALGRGGGVDLRRVDPALLQSVVDQLSYNGNGGGGGGGLTSASRQSRARSAARTKSGSNAGRLAQGLWAQELLKERHYI